jgi:hypothetical protein
VAWRPSTDQHDSFSARLARYAAETTIGATLVRVEIKFSSSTVITSAQLCGNLPRRWIAETRLLPGFSPVLRCQVRTEEPTPSETLEKTVQSAIKRPLRRFVCLPTGLVTQQTPQAQVQRAESWHKVLESLPTLTLMLPRPFEENACRCWRRIIVSVDGGCAAEGPGDCLHRGTLEDPIICS